jgi:serine/threonine protein kinase
MVQKCGGRFSAKTAILVAEQVIHRIEYLHSKGIVHRDIKPENFMFGITGRAHHVYLIDFGLSKRYWDKKHSPMRQRLSLTGTARYASINAHKGLEQSRRDDLEAIGHMLMYFLRGAVPWSGLDAKNKEEKYKKIMQKKEETPLPELCDGYPECFESFLRYSRGLQFTERPDYDMLQENFKNARIKEGGPNCQDSEFEWFKGTRPPDMVALLPRARIMQPDDPDEKQSGPAKRRGFCLCGSASAVRE